MTENEQAELDTAEAIAIANLPEDVKELILSYKLANDCLRLANESQRAEIEDLRSVVMQRDSLLATLKRARHELLEPWWSGSGTMVAIINDAIRLCEEDTEPK